MEFFLTVEVGRRSQKVSLEYQERQQAHGLIPFFFFVCRSWGLPWVIECH